MPKTVQQVRETLRDYQKRGVAFLTSRPYAILGDDTGLGKSLQTIIAADILQYDRVLVICPLIGLVSWRHELAKWMTRDRKFRQYDKNASGIPDGPLIYLLPYSTLSTKEGRQHAMRMLRGAKPFRVAILDEAHFLSNVDSARTEAVYGTWAAYSGGVLDAARVTSVWVLSATIQRRDVRDLYPHLKALFPEVITTALGKPANAEVRRREYEQTFLIYDHTEADENSRKYGKAYDPNWAKVIGNDNSTVPKLRDALKPYILARRKRDVAPELGSIELIDLPLGIEVDEDYTPRLKDPQFGKALVEELWANSNLQGSLILSETAAEERRTLGMIKVRPVTRWIEDFMLGTFEKLVVFAWHRDVLRELHERLAAWKPVLVMGGQDDAERAYAVELFQNDDSCRIFLGQTIASGTSITLTASSTVLTVEPDWLPHNDYQANSRVHRIGQTAPVINYRCFVDGTIDTRIVGRANARYRDFLVLMDGLISPV